ncbi:MAG: hypothetical protein KAS01_02320 [Candidatus Pacebacteria bacterium]|nr:hypothetical protein [Candidatus Paceibacterota bacterium]
MELHTTIESVIVALKKSNIETDEFFIAAELIIKGQKVKVCGIINISKCNLLVKNGLTTSKNIRYKSYGPGTRIISIF